MENEYEEFKKRVWYNLINTKYQALYLSFFNARIRTVDRWLEGIIKVGTSGSIAYWLIWKDFPQVWGVIVGIAQVMLLLKPLFPFFKDKEVLADYYLFFETQHKAYKKCWDELNMINSDQESTTVTSLRESLQKIENEEIDQLRKTKHFLVPEWKSIVKKARPVWENYLEQNF